MRRRWTIATYTIEYWYFYKIIPVLISPNNFVQTHARLSYIFTYFVYFNHPVIPRIFHIFMKIRKWNHMRHDTMGNEEKSYLFWANGSFCKNATLKFHAYILFLEFLSLRSCHQQRKWIQNRMTEVQSV